MPYDKDAVGRVICKLRKKKGLSQEILSGLAGIPRSHLSMIETGYISPTVETLWKVSEALGMRLSEVIRMAEGEMDIRIQT